MYSQNVYAIYTPLSGTVLIILGVWGIYGISTLCLLGTILSYLCVYLAFSSLLLNLFTFSLNIILDGVFVFSTVCVGSILCSLSVIFLGVVVSVISTS